MERSARFPTASSARISASATLPSSRTSDLAMHLAIVKAQQDLKHETKVMTNSEKTGYKKRGREESMGQTTMRITGRKQRWKCRSDGKHGTIELSHASHSPWKSPKNGDFTHFHRTTATGFTLTFLTGE